MTLGIDPEELDRVHRSRMTPKAIAGRCIMVVLLIALFTGIVVVMAQ
jgi:hypothetical protein